MNLGLIFLTGLTTGGLSCLAVQGGFLASIIANQKEQELDSHAQRKDWIPVGLFLIAKLISHTILGFALGLLGASIALSDGAKLFFQAFAAFFMFATAMNLLNVHPIFRYAAFQPPAFITRRVRSLKYGNTYIAPFVLGLFTIFIPCGVTQAMEVSAIALGNPIQSALLMAAFVLGTFPIFGLVGVTMAKLSDSFQQRFLRIAAVLLIGMALYSFNSVLEVMNFPVRGSVVTRAWVDFWTPDPVKRQNANMAQLQNGVQQVTIDVLNTGYSPNRFQVKKDVPVSLTLRSNGVYSCALSFSFRAFNIKTFLNATDQKTFTFTPTQAGTYPFSCSMGMYTGVMEVI